MRSDLYDNPADDPEAEGFLRKLAESKGDPLHRLIFADWLDDNGYDGAAHGQRWAAKYRKAPKVATPEEGYYVGGWDKDRSNQSHAHDHDPENPHQLPRVFTKLSPLEPLKHGGVNNHAYLNAYGGTDPAVGSLHNERHFLGRSHELGWDEGGEPFYKMQKDEEK